MISVISKNEHVMTRLCRNGQEVGIITANEMETIFYLYEPVGKDYRKLSKAESPLELERRYKMLERMGLK